MTCFTPCHCERGKRSFRLHQGFTKELRQSSLTDSQMKVLLPPPPPPSFLTRWSNLLRLLQEFDRVEDAFIFSPTMLTQGNMSCSFVKLLVFCDQLWLSHWTCLPVKPDSVVRFSLKWKGNTVRLPQASITVWCFLTLSIMWEYHQNASEQHISVEVMGSESLIMVYNLKPHFGRVVKL